MVRSTSIKFSAVSASRIWRITVLGLSAVLIGCASTPPTPPSTATPFSSRQIDLDQCSIYERTLVAQHQGEEIRFVFIGGMLGPGKIFEPLATRLTERLPITAVVVDLPGMGRSRMRGMSYTWSNQRACLAAYLQSQPPFVLVVHDIAGPIALPLLPQLRQLRGVVVLNTLFDTGNLRSPFPLNWIRHAGPMGKPLAYTMNFPFYQMRMRQMGIARDDQVPKTFLRSVYEEIIVDGGKGRLAEVLQGFELGAATDQAIRDGLAVNVPQMFIWGEADPALGKEIDKLPPRRNNQRLERFPEAKHFLMLDFDEEITNLIEAWLQKSQIKGSASLITLPMPNNLQTH